MCMCVCECTHTQLMLIKGLREARNLMGFGQNLTSFKFSNPKPLSPHKLLFLSLMQKEL